MKTRWTVTKKSVLSISIFALILSALMCLSGSYIFNRAIQKEYNDKGYVIANIILDEIDHDKIAEYTTTWRGDDYYKEMSSYLRGMQQHTGAAYIYIVVPYEDRTMRYIYDPDTFMGDTDPIAASFDEIWTAYKEGVRPQSYLVRKSKKYGFLTSSCMPVKDSSGNVVALLFVDTYMEVILSTLYSYIFYMIVIALILLALYVVFSYIALKQNLIGPLLTIKNNVSSFARNNAQPDDTLDAIKTGDEMQDLAEEISSMEKDIVNYIDSIKTITAEKERISAELDVAAKIQSDMLPSDFPPFPDRKEFDIYATMDPAKIVGGDFYDFFFLDDDHLVIVMADVSGKGIPAALFMVNAKTSIKNRTLNGGKLSPSQVLYDVNNQLCEGNDAELFVTVWLGILEISTGKVVEANAGHEHPAVRKAGGEFELVKYKHSPAVATLPGLKFRENEFTLDPGDSLFIYTDGVTEATNSEDKLFKTDGLLRVLNSEPDADARRMCEIVAEGIDEFVGDAPQFDDITMLGFKYLGNK